MLRLSCLAVFELVILIAGQRQQHALGGDLSKDVGLQQSKALAFLEKEVTGRCAALQETQLDC